MKWKYLESVSLVFMIIPGTDTLKGKNMYTDSHTLNSH